MKLPNDKQAIVTRHNKVVYDCGDTVAKVFNATKPSSDIVNEALNLTRAEQAGVDVPELIEVGKVGNNWAILTKKVEGKTLRQLMGEDPDKIDEHLERLIELELSVHAHRAPLMNRQKDKYARMIADAAEILNEAQRYELLVRLDGMPNHAKLCHGDFVPSNVIIPDDGSDAYVIDWAHVTAGVPEVDAAQTYLLFKVEHPDSAEKYLDMYSGMSGMPRQAIMNWVPVVAAAELARGRRQREKFLLSQVEAMFADI